MVEKRFTYDGVLEELGLAVGAGGEDGVGDDTVVVRVLCPVLLSVLFLSVLPG
ncbi:hypothetical protein ACFLU6_10025 [Acidobacteriota bacterium]